MSDLFFFEFHTTSKFPILGIFCPSMITHGHGLILFCLLCFIPYDTNYQTEGHLESLDFTRVSKYICYTLHYWP